MLIQYNDSLTPYFFCSRATNLIAMDTNGMSDPFVEIIFGRNIHLKTKTINKNCNPVWNEKFTLYIDDRSALANLHVSIMRQWTDLKCCLNKCLGNIATTLPVSTDYLTHLF